jgi:hypothetical protein
VCGAIPPLPNMPPWCGAQLQKEAQGQLYCYFYSVLGSFKKLQAEANTLILYLTHDKIQGCIQKFPDWLPGARTANGMALCH